METTTQSPAEAPAAAVFDAADTDGFFATYEQIPVPMSQGTSCTFFLAKTAEGYFSGYEFLIRSPKNHVKTMPWLANGVAGALDADSRKEILLRLIDANAAKFFSDHKAALKKLDEFRKELAGDELEGAKPAPKTLMQIIGMETEELRTYAEQTKNGIAISELEDRDRKAAAAAAPAMPQDNRESLTDLGHHLYGDICAPAAPIERPYFGDIPVDAIERNPDNHRSDRTEADIAELAESIKARGGLLQPIGVRDMGEGPQRGPAWKSLKRYRLIFGEGRWLAHIKLERPTIEARIYRGITDADALAMAIVENLQRHDINALDEADGFAHLESMGWTQAQMAQETGKAEITIRKSLSLVKLPAKVRQQLREGKLSARQGRELARWKDRPEVCECIGRAAEIEHISSDDLAADKLPIAAIEYLEGEGLIVRVPYGYNEKIPENVAGHPEDYVRVGQAVFCWSKEVWKRDKKEIDRVLREAAELAAKKAAEKLAKASAGKASVPVADMQKGGVELVELTGEREIFADYLPAESIATAIARDKSEIVVCLRPQELKKLEVAYQAAVQKNLTAVMKAAGDRALAKIAKLKTFSGREMAIVTRCIAQGGYDSGGYPTSADFKAAGVKEPKGSQIELAYWAKLTPVEQLKVILAQEIQVAADRESTQAVELLCWILEEKKLGLITEDSKARDKLLEQLAAEIWPPAKATPEAVAKFKWNENGVCTNGEKVCVPMRAPCHCEIRLACGPDGFWRFGYDYGIAGAGTDCGGGSGGPRLRDAGVHQRVTALINGLAQARSYFSGHTHKAGKKGLADILEFTGKLDLDAENRPAAKKGGAK